MTRTLCTDHNLSCRIEPTLSAIEATAHGLVQIGMEGATPGSFRTGPTGEGLMRLPLRAPTTAYLLTTIQSPQTFDPRRAANAVFGRSSAPNGSDVQQRRRRRLQM
jgi:hypothetical protein